MISNRIKQLNASKNALFNTDKGLPGNDGSSAEDACFIDLIQIRIIMMQKNKSLWFIITQYDRKLNYRQIHLPEET